MTVVFPHGSPAQVPEPVDGADSDDDFSEEEEKHTPWGALDIEARAQAKELAPKKYAVTFQKFFESLSPKPPKGARKKGDPPPVEEHMLGLERNKERISALQLRIAERAVMAVAVEHQTNQQLEKTIQNQEAERKKLDDEIAALTQDIAALQAAQAAQQQPPDPRPKGSASGTPRPRRRY
jgi:hypothetical protein